MEALVENSQNRQNQIPPLESINVSKTFHGKAFIVDKRGELTNRRHCHRQKHLKTNLNQHFVPKQMEGQTLCDRVKYCCPLNVRYSRAHTLTHLYEQYCL